MTNENRMRTIISEGKSSVNTRLWNLWPTFVEAAASSNSFDYIEFVAEYAPFTLYDLENFARVCEQCGIGSMVKVDFQNRFYVAQRALACGIQSILFTDHHNAAEVRETLRCVTPETPENGGCFGYPNGRWIGYNPELKQMDYAKMNASAVKAFMIEKKEAMDSIEEICSVPGVDMVQFGPSDYCMSLGWNCAEHQEDIRIAQEKMIVTALAHGVQPRVEIANAEQAAYYSKLGVRHFCVLDQMDILISAWTGVCADVKNLANEL